MGGGALGAAPCCRAGRHRLRIRQYQALSRCFHAEGWDAVAHRLVRLDGG